MLKLYNKKLMKLCNMVQRCTESPRSCAIYCMVRGNGEQVAMPNRFDQQPQLTGGLKLNPPNPSPECMAMLSAVMTALCVFSLHVLSGS